MRIAITVEVMNKINACAALLRCSWLTAIVSNLNPTTMKISPVRPAEAPPDIAANVVHKPVHLFPGLRKSPPSGAISHEGHATAYRTISGCAGILPSSRLTDNADVGDTLVPGRVLDIKMRLVLRPFRATSVSSCRSGLPADPHRPVVACDVSWHPTGHDEWIADARQER